MNKIIFSVCLFLFSQNAFAGCTEFVQDGVFPQATPNPQIVLCKKNYVVGYSVKLKSALWSAMKIVADETLTSKVRPTFRADPTLPAEQQSANADFIGTKFDKGHLSAFEDLTMDTQSRIESMYLTNIVPQLSANNRGIWKALEGRTRKKALEADVYVISGPIFSQYPKTIGKGVPVPDKLFKVIITKNTTTIYIVPNNKIASSRLDDFLDTQENLEKLTHLRFSLPK